MLAKLFSTALFGITFGIVAFGVAACDGGSSPAQTTAQLPPPQVMSIMLFPDSIQLKGDGLSSIGQIQIQIEATGFSVMLPADPPDFKDDGSLLVPLDRSLAIGAGKTYQVTLLDSEDDPLGSYSVLCSGD